MGKQYIVKGAMAQCNQSKVPMIAQLNLIPDNMFVNMNGNPVATTMTLGPVFGPAPFGICNMIPPTPAVPTPPCVCAILSWSGADTAVKINMVSSPLTTDSKGTCALGGSISFKMSGQFPKPSIPPIPTPAVPDMNAAAETPKKKAQNKAQKTPKVDALPKAVPASGDLCPMERKLSPQEEKMALFAANNVSPALLNDQDALKNLDIETFQRSAWENDGFFEDFKDGKCIGSMNKKEFITQYRKANKGVKGTCLEGYGPEKYGQLTDRESKELLRIRHEIHKNHPVDENTVFQKVVTCGDIQAWVKSSNERAIGGHLSIGGSTLRAADGTHLKTPSQIYDGMQLNYPGSPYKGCKKVYVVRYTSCTPEASKIPVHDINEVPEDIRGDFVEKRDNQYPFTGNGFTPGVNGNMGTPEIICNPPDGLHVISKAVIVRIDEDGTETIVGYTVEKRIKGKKVKQFIVKE